MKSKKILALLLVLSLTAALAACTQTNRETNGSSVSQSFSEQESQSTPEEEQESEVDEEYSYDENAFDPIMVMDAALYRGTITGIKDEESTLTLTLAQAEGTDFGADTMDVVIDENTKSSFAVDTLKTGMYVEVYYGASLGEEVQESVTAIAVNKLPDADMAIYNGTLKEITPDEETEGEGRFLLQSLDGEDQILFHYNQETQFYLNFDELKEGDSLNVYFNGITTRSIPPQATAMEVRLLPQG